MKTIYFVRHGLSEANIAKIASGAEMETPLAEEGRLGAKKAGQDLKSKHIDLIVCSPMKRTIETAQIIAKEIGYDSNKIVTNKAFIERYFGRFSGGTDQAYKEFVDSGKDEDSVEKAEDMVTRVRDGLEWLKKQKGDSIVLVAHGGTGRILKIIFENLHHSEMYKMDAFTNAAVYKFTLE